MTASESTPLTLADKHRAELHASGIPDDLIAAAGIYTAEGSAVKKALGWTPKGVSWGPGWVVPFRFPGQPDGYCRVKLDFPRKDKSGGTIKYESPLNAPNRVYYPPGFFDRLSDNETPILITEGEKKALSATAAGFCCLGLVGVWNFAAKRRRRETGKATGPRKFLNDLHLVHWHGRKVYIVFDSDAADKKEVRQAERELAGMLAGVGADVAIVRLKPAANGAKVGLDDYLFAHGHDGPEKLRELLAEAKHADPERTADEKIPPFEWADQLISETFGHPDGFRARHWRDELHVWNGTHYRPVPTTEFRRFVLGYLDRHMDGARPKLAAEVVECVASRLLHPGRYDQPMWIGENGPKDPSDWIAVQNGILDLRKVLAGEQDVLRPHSPLWFSPTCLPHDYDPRATCPNWFQFLYDTLDDDIERINLLGEWFGYCLTTDTRYQSILMLQGPRRSGKGTTLRILRKLIGEANCASPRLSRLDRDFGLWGLLGKTCAICPDAHVGRGNEAVGILEILKSISGEDELEVQRKYLPSINVRFRIKFTLAVNDLPKFGDSSGALASRMHIIRYKNSWLGQEDRQLEERLSTEMPGILNWSIEGLQRLQQQGRFTKPRDSEEIEEELERISSPITAFVRDMCITSPAEMIKRSELYSAWESWCKMNNHLPGSRETFGSQLRNIVRGLESKMKRDPETHIPDRYYVGIRLKTDDDLARIGEDSLDE